MFVDSNVVRCGVVTPDTSLFALFAGSSSIRKGSQEAEQTFTSSFKNVVVMCEMWESENKQMKRRRSKKVSKQSTLKRGQCNKNALFSLSFNSLCR